MTDFQLIIIGDGPERMVVESFAARVDWVRYVGARVGREKAAYFRLAYVALNPGLIGLGILDAFACGLPVITTEIDIHSPEIEYLEDGENGVSCRPDLSVYADTVADVLTNRSLHARLSAGALASADQYSVETMVQNFRSGILRCLRRERRSPRPLGR